MVTPRYTAPPPTPGTAPPPPPPNLSAEAVALLRETGRLVKWKMGILEKLDTKSLVDQLQELEKQLENALSEERKCKIDNRGYIAGASDDCAAVKELLARLWLDAPTVKPDGAKATQSDKEAWLRQQRTDNKELNAAIARQGQVLTMMESFRLEIENVKRRLDQTAGLIRLRTAQIEFLARSI